MNVRKSVKKALFWAITAGLVASGWGAGAAQNGTGAGTSRKSERGMIYTSPAFGPAIHSYRNIQGVERKVPSPEIVYVDQAHGPAIFSYPGAGGRTVAEFDLRYVNPAYGPAIYSYPGLYDSRGEVEVLPLIAE